MVQCLKTTTIPSNLLRPIRPRKPNRQYRNEDDIKYLKCFSLFWGTNPWPLDPNMWYLRCLMKNNITFFLIQEIKKIFIYSRFYSLLNINSRNLSRSVQQANWKWSTLQFSSGQLSCKMRTRGNVRNNTVTSNDISRSLKSNDSIAFVLWSIQLKIHYKLLGVVGSNVTRVPQSTCWHSSSSLANVEYILSFQHL